MSYVLEYVPKPEPTYLSFNAATFPENVPPSNFFNEEAQDDNSPLSEGLNSDKTHLDFKLFGQKDKRILHAENSKFEYIGKNFGEHSEKNQETRYLLGVLESKKRMKLFDIDHVFNMKQNKKLKVETVELNPSSKLNALEQKQMLVAEFGTKKSKKKLQQMLNNIVEEKNINSTNEIQNILQEKALDIEKKMDEQDENHMSEELKSKRSFLPDFNLKSATPQKIYDIHSIISLDEWNALNIKYALKIIKNEASPSRELKFYTDFVYDKLVKFNDIFEKSKGKTINVVFKVKILLYLDFLLKVFKNRSYYKPVEVVARELNMKPIFLQNILNKFYQMTPVQNSEKTGFKYNRINDDKMICYIIVLCLFFFDFNMEARGLSQYLKVDTKRFVLYCKEIGCSVVIKEDKKTEEQSIKVNLKAPLQLLIQSKEEMNKIKRKKKN